MKGIVCSKNEKHSVILDANGNFVFQDKNSKIGDVLEVKSNKKISVITGIVTLFALILVVSGMSFLSHKGATVTKNVKEAYSVYIDVNPAFTFQCNEKHQIIGIEARNEEAKPIVQNLSSKVNEEIINGLDKLVKEVESKKYNVHTKEKAMLISFSCKKQQNKSIINEAYKKTKKYCDEQHISAEVIITVSGLEDDGMSKAKSDLINQIMALTSAYTYDQLKEMSIAELNKIKDNCKNTGSGNTNGDGSYDSNNSHDNPSHTPSNKKPVVPKVPIPHVPDHTGTGSAIDPPTPKDPENTGTGSAIDLPEEHIKE